MAVQFSKLLQCCLGLSPCLHLPTANLGLRQWSALRCSVLLRFLAALCQARQFNFINSFKGLFFPAFPFLWSPLGFPVYWGFFLASPQARGWGSAYRAYHVFPVAASVESKGLCSTLVGHGSSHWSFLVVPSPHCYCCCYHQMIYWRLGCKENEKKKAEKQMPSLLYLTLFLVLKTESEGFSWTLFCKCQYPLQDFALHWFSPGDIGGVKINLLLICVTLISGLLWGTIMPVSPLSVGPSTLVSAQKWHLLLILLHTTYLVAGRKRLQIHALSRFYAVFSGGDRMWVCLPLSYTELETPSQFFKGHKSMQVYRGGVVLKLTFSKHITVLHVCATWGLNQVESCPF